MKTYAVWINVKNLKNIMLVGGKWDTQRVWFHLYESQK